MKKFNLFKMFSSKPITKDDEYSEIPTNFKGFFVMLGRKFWNISNLNLVYVLCNFPVFFLLFVLTGQLDETRIVTSSPMFSSYFGFSSVSDSSILHAIFPFIGSFRTAFVPTTWSYVFYGISALLILTFGLSNTGAAYCIRGYNRGDPIFIFSDFFGCIKRNFKQAVIVGLADVAISFLLIYDFLFWIGQSGTFINSILVYFSIFLCVLYFIMRFYIYTIMITFDLSVYKIFKDAFLLTFLGLKRNFVAVFGILVLVFINLYLFVLLNSLGIMLPFIITIALGMFISGYASYPVIQKYMIDPFYNDDINNSSYNDGDGEDGEAVFVDRG